MHGPINNSRCVCAGHTALDIAKTQSTFQVIKMCASLRNAEAELSDIQQQRRKSESKVRRRLKTVVKKATLLSPGKALFSPCGNRSRQQSMAAAALESRMKRNDFSDMGVDPEVLCEEGQHEYGSDESDTGHDDGGDEKNPEIHRTESVEPVFNSFKVGALPPSKQPCVFENKKVVSALAAK